MNHWERCNWRAIAVCGLLVCLADVSSADVIVLKNGRQITAVNIKETDGKVIGETPAGTITLPLSMVDHIQRDAAGSSPAADLRMDRPPSPAEAGAGTPAVSRAAAAESSAAVQEFNRGNLDEAVVHAERAVAFEPTSVALLLDAAYFRLRRAEYTVALDYLARARRVAPDSAEVAKLTGWADYGLNRLPQAVEEWRRAQKLQPDDDTAAALAKAERDLEAERNFREDGSEHFVLRFDGAAAPELARSVLRQLEGDFQSVSATLNYNPSEPLGVILYTNQAFSDITRAPAWAGAINDGRIRIPVQGLTSVTPDLARVLRHELTHSLIAGKTHGRCPVWLQEGVAQWMDGSHLSGGNAVKLLALYDRHEDPSLAALEGSWMNLPEDFVGNAYGWSLAVVEALVHNGGPSDIERLLDRVATATTTESAARSALRLDYTELNRLTAEYLRNTYQH
jgi:hypothetical protein